MMRQPEWLVIGFTLCVVSGCTESGYRRAKVIKMAVISTPDNLADDPLCQELWGNIARYGIDMDTACDDWNQIILNAASELIENG